MMKFSFIFGMVIFSMQSEALAKCRATTALCAKFKIEIYPDATHPNNPIDCQKK